MLLITSNEKFSSREPEYANLTEKEFKNILERARYEIVDLGIIHHGMFYKALLKNIK